MNSSSGCSSTLASRETARSKSLSRDSALEPAFVLESFDILEGDLFEGFIHSCKVYDVEGAQGPQPFEFLPDSVHDRTGNRLRTENAYIDVRPIVSIGPRFRTKDEHFMRTQIDDSRNRLANCPA